MRNRPDPRSRGFYLPQTASRSPGDRRRRSVALLLLALLATALALIIAAATSRVDTRGADVMRYSISSPLAHHTLAQVAVLPPGPPRERRGLLVFLHGKGQDQESNLVSGMFAALARLGSRAPAVVFPDGGEDSYWHDRGDGAWGRYVMREVIPQALARTHADPRRIAIGGLSMGGFGAYDLARLYPRSFCAVGADSAALWRSGGETAPGAFDDSSDFARNDVIAYARDSADPYAGTRLWLDVGAGDPFRGADTALASELRAHGRPVSFHVWPGGHEPGYWNSHWSSYIGFYAAALASCG
jgi:S-formylglutathione hydrolase FrmB